MKGSSEKRKKPKTKIQAMRELPKEKEQDGRLGNMEGPEQFGMNWTEGLNKLMTFMGAPAGDLV